MTEIVKNKKKIKKNRWNYCHHFPILPLLGANHSLPLLHMATRFLWLHETGEHINEFDIGYMINPLLNFDKTLK